MGFINCKGPDVVENTCEGCLVWREPQRPRKPRIFKFKELEKATNCFAEKNILGKGSHSCVYQAVLNNGDVVAVKRPTLGRRALDDAMSFDNELDILSRLRHRHLVNLIGFCNEAHEKLLVVEFMERGTLFDLLHSRREPLSWWARIHMALQAAQALLALHSASPPIIHRDVKSSNILIDSNWNAKLSDLGLAVRGQLEDVTKKGTPPAGTMGYIDPEYQTPAQLSSKADVFSFGIVLLEIMSGRKAIDVRYNPSSLLDWALPLIRQGNALDVCDKTIEPPQNIKVVHFLASIAARSVRQSKDRRPTMIEVVDGLQKVRRKLPSPRFGGMRQYTSPLAAAAAAPAPKADVIREGPLKRTTSQLSGPKDEVRDDSGEAVSFSKSEVFSVFDDSKASGEVILSSFDTQSSSSQVYRRSWRAADADGNGQATATTSQAVSAARVPSSKHESPLFLDNSSQAKAGSFTRLGMSRNSAASPHHPLSTPPQKTVASSLQEKNSLRRPVESTVFGSKNTVRMRDSSSMTPQRILPQGFDFRLNSNEKALGFQLALEKSNMSRSTSIERSNNSSKGDVQLRPQSSVLEQSRSQAISNKGKEITGADMSTDLKVLRDTTTNRISRVGGRADRDAKVDVNGGLLSQPSVSSSSNLKELRDHGARKGGSASRDVNLDSLGGAILQATVPFRMDMMPNWGLGMSVTSSKYYKSSEPLFDKVDLPILV